MEIPNSVIEKMQKLLNLKEGAEAVGSLSEAENAAAKLQEMLLKYNFDQSELQRLGAAAKGKPTMKKIHINVSDVQDKRESNWVQKLYYSVGSNNLCDVRYYDDRVTVLIMGHEVNVQMVMYMTEQLISKVKIAEKLAWKQYEGYEKRGVFRRGFLEGAAYGIGNRLESEMRKAKEHVNNPLAPMIVSKEAELNEYLIEQGYRSSPEAIAKYRSAMEELERKYQSGELTRPKQRKIKPRKGPRGNSSNDGYWEGKKAGESMNISKGID